MTDAKELNRIRMQAVADGVIRLKPAEREGWYLGSSGVDARV